MGFSVFCVYDQRKNNVESKGKFDFTYKGNYCKDSILELMK